MVFTSGSSIRAICQPPPGIPPVLEFCNLPDILIDKAHSGLYYSVKYFPVVAPSHF